MDAATSSPQFLLSIDGICMARNKSWLTTGIEWKRQTCVLELRTRGDVECDTHTHCIGSKRKDIIPVITPDIQQCHMEISGLHSGDYKDYHPEKRTTYLLIIRDVSE
jgi:hypothetical protein